MRKLILILFAFLSAVLLYAQSPQAFKYQTIVRDASGDIMANNAGSIRISIHEGSPTGTIVYQETHEVLTNDFGLINIEIGNGTATIGVFSAIDWSTNHKYLEVELGPPGGFFYDPMGTSQLLSVPFALYAESSSITEDNDWVRNGDYIYTINDSVGIGTSSPGAMLDVSGPIWQNNTGGSVFLGEEAGSMDDGTDNQNVFVGYQAGDTNTTGGRNVFIGYRSGSKNAGGTYNTFIGRQSGLNNIDANSNTFVGNNSGLSNEIGWCNTFLGEACGVYNTEGWYNTFIGYKTSESATTGHHNVALGCFANQHNQEGSRNTIIGYEAGRFYSEHSKSGNVFLGYNAGYFELGDNRLYIENTDADSANALIYGEFDNNLLALNASVGIGTSNPGATLEVAGPIWQSNTGESVFLGREAGSSDDGTDNQNVFIGYQAGEANSSGGRNTFIGYRSGYYNTSGDWNTFIGRQSGLNNSGSANTFIGHKSGYANITGGGNVLIGESSGSNNTSGNGNTCLGYKSGVSNTTGGDNVCIGGHANHYNQGGVNNTILGSWAGAGSSNHDKSGNVFIGHSAGYYETGDNKLYIENSDADSVNALIYGEFDNNLLAMNAKVGIGTASPATLFSNSAIVVTDGVDSTAQNGLNWQISGENYALGIENSAGNGSGLLVKAGNNSGGGSIVAHFISDEASLLYVGENGNVGVGTNDPYSKFHVTGKIWQSGLGGSTIVGEAAGNYDDGSENWNVFIGKEAGFSNTTGEKNVFIGYKSGYTNETGINNTIIGRESGFYNTSHNNVFIGNKSGYNNTTGDGNSFVGNVCGFYTTDGYQNSGFGYNNSYYNALGYFNTSMGAYANYYNQNGIGNTILGYAAGMGTSVHNKHYNVFIGFHAGYNETGSHRLYIENSDADSANALIYGEFDNDLLAVNGNVGIRTTEPDVPLHVVGGTDASISNGGYIVIGQITSDNIVIDDNEIIARYNGLSSNLNVNREGANVILNEFAGSVGIGTQNPMAKLHVNGAMRLGTGVRDYEFLEVDPSYPDGWSSLISYGGIGIGSNDGTNRQMFMFTDGSTSHNIFTVATSQNNGASWEADLVIRQDGNVGINTTSPARKLHISDVMRLEPRSTAPGSPSEGDLYVNSTDHHIYCYLSGAWKQLD